MEAKCPKCGTNYHGWALRKRQHQFCARCGAELKIKNNRGLSIPKGLSPTGGEVSITNSTSSAKSSSE